MQSPSMITMIFFKELKKIIKFICKNRRLRITKAILSKESEARGITTHNVKLYYKVVVIKTAWYWHQKRHEEQCNNRVTEKPRNLHHVTFDKDDKNISWNKDTLLTNDARKWDSCI